MKPLQDWKVINLDLVLKDHSKAVQKIWWKLAGVSCQNPTGRLLQESREERMAARQESNQDSGGFLLLYVCMYLFWDMISWSPGWPQTSYLAKDDPAFLILLTSLHKGTLPDPVFGVHFREFWGGTESHVAQADLRLTMWPKTTLNFWFFCLWSPNAGNASMYHQA